MLLRFRLQNDFHHQTKLKQWTAWKDIIREYLALTSRSKSFVRRIILLAFDRYAERFPRGRLKVGKDERHTSQTPDCDTHDRQLTTRHTNDLTRYCGSCGKRARTRRG
ncbi:hypothetical protein DPMN_169974 [Dreissena polymorpha]|uniref:Uncharacterized protein n=1 Tax=Dreissena polymorpha TaxID=45954 RepID=A0A9D4IDU9_DREPO|nr:hypothetical protein DPMN_169974 [Dreissena polymorpha]